MAKAANVEANAKDSVLPVVFQNDRLPSART